MFFQLLIYSVLLYDTNALDCAVCSNITSPHDCHNYIQCKSGERCFTSSEGIGPGTMYELSCKSEAACLGTSSASLVGRALGSRCAQCCAIDHCNNHLCSAGTQVTNEVGKCADDPNYDCKQFSSLFNICTDIAHAKTACRRWCGLCNLVDGAWSTWNGWSSCDVTCSQGQMTRTRTCTDPAPEHGGLLCVGNNTEYKLCVLDPCPIHGGWGTWATWSPCSNTCGIGTQSRRRLCDSPVPQLAGNHCFGDSNEYKACFERSCVDGNWSSWTQWSTCSDGLKTRNRSCTNPTPSQFGASCLGNYEEWHICNLNNQSGHVAFTVTHPNKTLVDGHPIFTWIVTNVGGGYDPNTAKFTCPIAGLYQFTVSLTSTSHYVYCSIQKNGVHMIYAQTDVSSSNQDTATETVYLQLVVGDIVSLANTGYWNYVFTGDRTSFSGALIST